MDTDLATLEAQLLEASKPGAFVQVDHDVARQAAAAVARLRRMEAVVEAARHRVKEHWHPIQDYETAHALEDALAALNQPPEPKA